MGLTAPWADHEKNVCFFVSATISALVMGSVIPFSPRPPESQGGPNPPAPFPLRSAPGISDLNRKGCLCSNLMRQDVPRNQGLSQEACPSTPPDLTGF